MAASSGDQFRGASLEGRGAVKEPSERKQKGGIQGGKERAIREVRCEWGVRAQGVNTLSQWLRCNQNQWQCILRSEGQLARMGNTVFIPFMIFCSQIKRSRQLWQLGSDQICCKN